MLSGCTHKESQHVTNALSIGSKLPGTPLAAPVPSAYAGVTSEVIVYIRTGEFGYHFLIFTNNMSKENE